MPSKASSKEWVKQAGKRFDGKVAVVTGASLQGIGGAVARRLAAEGAALHLWMLEDASQLLDELKANGTEVHCSPCDVTSPKDVEDASKTCLETFGQVDVVVNNAGIETAVAFAEMNDDQWQQLVDVNLTGVMRVTRALLPLMGKRGGAIVNVSSTSSLAGTAGLTGYGATKAGINGMTQALALELAPRKIRVVGVAPALVRTPMAARHVESLTAEGWEQLQQCHPLGVGVPDDVAAAIAFLGSDEARWISGVTLPLGWMPMYPLPNLLG